jgi:hypothetical protein
LGRLGAVAGWLSRLSAPSGSYGQSGSWGNGLSHEPGDGNGGEQARGSRIERVEYGLGFGIERAAHFVQLRIEPLEGSPGVEQRSAVPIFVFRLTGALAEWITPSPSLRREWAEADAADQARAAQERSRADERLAIEKAREHSIIDQYERVRKEHTGEIEAHAVIEAELSERRRIVRNDELCRASIAARSGR